MFAFLDARFLACFGPFRGPQRPPALVSGKILHKTHQNWRTRKVVNPDDGIDMNVRFLGRAFFGLFWPIPCPLAPASSGAWQNLAQNAPKLPNPKSRQP